ncbi:Nramp family divalent metal transporter [Streptomyces radicis]|uniref:Divalent metal cation transporter MntH n=1 Tax=Streptomyces radicis TaxID=1750517 RepID=A0A3A9WJC9_9ACTN|nr:Nramp family divalent metal transporter [Streptomyces radicis]RKN12869.1 divalent metal cation transporter MntH [Streptomyces radicis]RKN27366.1 divalent metal cation transporter MntH [Streptomyces radicis]
MATTQGERSAGPRRMRVMARALGPAFVAAVAYVDPGNFATNIESGSTYGYLLLWVVIGAGLAAMPVQFLSAKLGIVTGLSLPEACRERFPRATSRALWVQAELMAMATDLAEFMGTAIALDLLFGMEPTAAVLLTAALSYLMLGVQRRRSRPFEVAVAVMLGLMCAGFGYLIARSGVDGGAAVAGLVPSPADNHAVLLALGIVGATVMPHAIYLHSALVRRDHLGGTARDTRRALRAERFDVLVALSLAGVINASMLLVAAGAFHDTGLPEVSALTDAHAALGTWVGGAAALVFALALLASGLSSSGIGTLSGQVVMEGFTGARIPLVIRRSITMLPAVAVAFAGWDPTQALILSQVVLSFGIAPALIPLLMITSDRSVMGCHANGRRAVAGYAALAGGIVLLNVHLLVQHVL